MTSLIVFLFIVISRLLLTISFRLGEGWGDELHPLLGLVGVGWGVVWVSSLVISFTKNIRKRLRIFVSMGFVFSFFLFGAIAEITAVQICKFLN